MGFIWDSILDVAADAIDGAITGKGDSFGAELGKAFREGVKEGLKELADDADDQAWFDWVTAFEDEVNAAYVYFEVKHKLGHKDCTLTAVIMDENDNLIDSNSWDVEYDEETKQLHKQVFNFHEVSETPSFDEWIVSFNDNPDADHTYSEVHHKMGEENATITVQVISKSGQIIAEESFEGSYEGLKQFHKDITPFPIVLDDDVVDVEAVESKPKAIEAPKEESSVEERLAKLKKLFDSGIIDEEEYKEKRKELIALL